MIVDDVTKMKTKRWSPSRCENNKLSIYNVLLASSIIYFWRALVCKRRDFETQLDRHNQEHVLRPFFRAYKSQFLPASRVKTIDNEKRADSMLFRSWVSLSGAAFTFNAWKKGTETNKRDRQQLRNALAFWYLRLLTKCFSTAWRSL